MIVGPSMLQHPLFPSYSHRQSTVSSCLPLLLKIENNGIEILKCYFLFLLYSRFLFSDGHTEITNVIDTRKNYVAANDGNSEAESMSLSGSRTINTPLTNLALFIMALSIMAFAT